ncbi:anaphase-promoting complex subunit 13-like [Ciona intestinalis]
MDSEVKVDGRLIDVIDEDWINDELPVEDIEVPLDELPELEQDNGNSHETIKELEKKWNDDNLQSLLSNNGNRQS